MLLRFCSEGTMESWGSMPNLALKTSALRIPVRKYRGRDSMIF